MKEMRRQRWGIVGGSGGGRWNDIGGGGAVPIVVLLLLEFQARFLSQSFLPARGVFSGEKPLPKARSITAWRVGSRVSGGRG